MVCIKKYHFILPSKNMAAAYLNFQGNEGEDAGMSSNLMQRQGHAMHGVFHSNGFGHLLCVNGVETGSDLTGHQIMDFWDRLCSGLQARFDRGVMKFFFFFLFYHFGDKIDENL